MSAQAVSLRTSDDRTCRFRRIAGGGIRCALEVTHRCNLACPHCFVARDEEEARIDELLPVLRQLAGVGCRKVVLTGGEPLVRPDLEAIVEACAGQGLLVDLNSNLITLTAPRARALLAAGLREASVSLYGDEAAHDWFVECAGAFARALRGIRLLRELGLPVDVHCALGAHNAAQMEYLATLCVELGCASLTFFTTLAPAASWRPGPGEWASLAALRARCSLPVRTIGMAETDMRECVMAEGIFGVTASLALKPCLLAEARGGSACDLRRIELAGALMRLRAEVAQSSWVPVCGGACQG
jgi:molybdenum cofactor biosynthesis enzyme MoaA